MKFRITFAQYCSARIGIKLIIQRSIIINLHTDERIIKQHSFMKRVMWRVICGDNAIAKHHQPTGLGNERKQASFEGASLLML